MLRTLTVLTLVLNAPLAAQVATSPPVAPKTPVSPMSPMSPLSSDPLSGSWRVASDLQSSLDRAQMNYNLATTLYSDLNYSYSINNAFDNLSLASSYSGDSFRFGSSNGPRAPWAKSDPADSLYRSARDLLNRGDYRRSTALFKELPQKFPTSVYVNDAMYWQAFGLYRIGGTPELQEALGVLETLKAKTPAEGNRNAARSSNGVGSASSASGSSSGGTTMVIAGDKVMQVPSGQSPASFSPYIFDARGGNDATALAARIANVLASRGMSNDAAVKRALAAAGNSCDSEDQQVRSEALSALSQTDPEMARQSAIRALSRKDECSVPLRRTAINMIGRKNDDAAMTVIIPVAKSDPSIDVRATAIDLLGRNASEAALTALQELSNAGEDRVQSAAIRALSNSTNPKAKAGMRALIQNNEIPEAKRLPALYYFGRESAPDDAAWLRSVYPKLNSTRMKEGVVSAMARIGGDANDAWLSALVRNEDEPMEARTSALRQAGRSMDVNALAKLYDAASLRLLRSQVIDLLADRKEPAAVDKLIDIAKTGTDPGLRRSAISALARSKDPRAQKLLLDLVDHE